MQLKDIIGDYQGFYDAQMADVKTAGFPLPATTISHIAYRTATWEGYLEKRAALESIAAATVENIWRGRPIAKILLKEPVALSEEHKLELIELIPPPHLHDWPMGLEHLGLVIGAGFDDFCAENENRFTEFQDMGPYCQPHLVTFGSGHTVKFYEAGLKDVVLSEGRAFDGFYHEDWPLEESASKSA